MKTKSRLEIRVEKGTAPRSAWDPCVICGECYIDLPDCSGGWPGVHTSFVAYVDGQMGGDVCSDCAHGGLAHMRQMLLKHGKDLRECGDMRISLAEDLADAEGKPRAPEGA